MTSRMLKVHAVHKATTRLLCDGHHKGKGTKADHRAHGGDIEKIVFVCWLLNVPGQTPGRTMSGCITTVSSIKCSSVGKIERIISNS